MGGGAVPPGFPQPNPVTSYWQVEPHRIANHRTTAELPTAEVFDYVIVGSGITGAAVAYKLLARDPTLRLLMLEARTAASGASGRNGGHCRGGFWLLHRLLVARHGEDEALKFATLEQQNVEDIVDFVREHGVDNDFREVLTADVYVTEKEWAETLATARAYDEVRRRRPKDTATLGDLRVWDGAEAREKLELPNIVGAVTYPGYTQNPYLLVCKMLELSLDKGLNLQTNTLVNEVVRAKGAGHAAAVAPAGGSHRAARWEVRTDRGNVHADKVVLATNGFTNALYRDLRETGFLTPGRSQVAAVRPGSKAAVGPHPALRGTRSTGSNDFNVTGDYFMARQPGLRGAGDVLWGGGRAASATRELGITDDTQVNPKIATYLHGAPAEFFGRDVWGEDGEVVLDWCGITCYTPDSYPLVGEAPGKEGLWMSVGMNGHGMAMAFRSAEALVELMTTGQEPDWFPKGFRLERAWDKPADKPADKLTVP
ncbi:FAD dependent oxidoreductase superfamily protein [Xylariales sp. PMI_506]|nr:FAD dependent oxidoreductase superfamily protein [Xylariales sp. PMI_506]